MIPAIPEKRAGAKALARFLNLSLIIIKKSKVMSISLILSKGCRIHFAR
jgi:hypothetical protein